MAVNREGQQAKNHPKQREKTRYQKMATKGIRIYARKKGIELIDRLE